MRSYKHLMTSPQYISTIVNGLYIDTNDCLLFANKQSLLLRTRTRSPTCKTTHRTPVWSIERSWAILVIPNVFWGVNQLETTLKLSKNLSKNRIFPCFFLEFCNFAWIMRFLTNYAKSCDLRSIVRNRNIAEYQKPCLEGNNYIICKAKRLSLKNLLLSFE